jgi:DNA-binding transcriptional MerR regulator
VEVSGVCPARRTDMSTTREPSTPAASLDGVERLLTIGVFARRSRLSPKALRLYDERGVLTPAHVDEDSGYRRYAETQLETARLVALLRRLEMPLAEVAAVVAAPEGRRAELVAQHWATVEDRFAHQRQLAEHLRIRLAGDEGGYDMYEILERDVPEQRFLTEQRHVLVQDLPGWLATSIGRLIESARAFGGQAGPTTVIYHGEVNEDSDGPVEACVPIAADQEVTGSVPSRVEPAHREAYTRISKAQVEFPQILSAYEAVDSWIRSEGKTITGSPREVYFADWDAAGPDDEVCDIAFPVA